MRNYKEFNETEKLCYDALIKFGCEESEAASIINSREYIYFPDCPDMSAVAYIIIKESYTDILEKLPDIIKNSIDYEFAGELLMRESEFIECGSGYLELTN